MWTCAPPGRSFFFSSRRRHTRFDCDWSSDVCSSDLQRQACRVQWLGQRGPRRQRKFPAEPDRKSVVEGKSVDLGGRRIIKKKKNKDIELMGPAPRVNKIIHKAYDG